MLGPLEAAVFDFDGTLVTLRIDFAAMRESVAELAEAYGVPPGLFDGKFVLEAAADAEEFIGRRDGPAAAEAFRIEAAERIELPELEAAARCDVIPGVTECLNALNLAGIKVGVVTRNCRRAVEPIIDRWTGLISVLVPRDGREQVKPHSSHLLDALRQLGCPPGRAVMVGDHPTDIACGKSVGTHTVGVLTGSASAEDLADADLILDSVASLPRRNAMPRTGHACPWGN